MFFLCLALALWVKQAHAEDVQNCASPDGSFVVNKGELTVADGSPNSGWKLGATKRQSLLRTITVVCVSSKTGKKITLLDESTTFEILTVVSPLNDKLDIDFMCQRGPSAFELYGDCKPGSDKRTEKFHVK